jgi:cytochrome c oxidase subunit II
MNVNYQRRLLMMGAIAGGMSALASAIAQPEEQLIKVVARRFTFTPSEISLKKGVPVVLELTTLDVVMGFNAPDFGVRSDIVPGKTSQVRFTPDKTGKFTFQCDIFCGSGHEDMNGVITVT